MAFVDYADKVDDLQLPMSKVRRRRRNGNIVSAGTTIVESRGSSVQLSDIFVELSMKPSPSVASRSWPWIGVTFQILEHDSTVVLSCKRPFDKFKLIAWKV